MNAPPRGDDVEKKIIIDIIRIDCQFPESASGPIPDITVVGYAALGPVI